MTFLSPLQRTVIALCFFLSGLSALVYEVVWVRQFELVFGAGSYAVGAVLAAYMGGLCLGGWAGGKVADRIARPWRAYGLLEVLIGLYALLFPFLYRLVHAAYLALESGRDLPVFGSLMVRFFAALCLMLIPTALMGASLPVLAKAFSGDEEDLGRKVGKLYGLNLLGAVAGVLLAGFLWIPSFGLSTAVHWAAILNLGLGALAFWIAKDASALVPSQREGAPAGFSPSANIALFLTAISGFAAMLYQIGFTRLLVMTLGASVYAFSTMLSVFLAGLGLGALAVSWAGWTREEGLRARLAWILGGTGLMAFLTGFLIDRLPYFFLWLYTGASHMGWEASAGQGPVQFLVCASVLLPTAVGLGAAFPMALAMGGPGTQRTGDWVGRAYAWNTLGAILGSALGAFALLPLFGVQRTLQAGILLHFAAAVILVFGSLKGRPVRWLAPAGWGALWVVLFFLPSWNRHRLAMGPYDNLRYVKVERLKDLKQGRGVRKMLVDRRVGSMDLLYYKEGVSSTVTVERNNFPPFLILFNNGKPEASTQTDLATQQLISHLPLLWFEASRGRSAGEVGMVGLASGISAGAALRHSLERLTVAEIEPSMPKAAAIFKDYNFDLLSDTRLLFVPDDGRHHLEVHSAAYDVIISEPSNPWISGVSNLFTREAFLTARGSLKENGVFCQWVQAYNMGLGDLKTIVRTFRSVFPHAYLFGVPPPPGGKEPGPDLILVGSTESLIPSIKEMERLVKEEKLKSALERIGIRKTTDLLGLLRMGPKEMDLFTGEGPLNTDDHNLIEFSAPRFFYRDTREENLAEVGRYSADPLKWVISGPAKKSSE